MKGSQLASQIKYYLDYSKWIEEEQRAENWDDSVSRIMNMHRSNPKFTQAFQNSEFIELFDIAEQAYREKLVFGSQRALQMGGAPIFKHNSKMFNCLSSYCDRIAFFQEAMYWLMSGCGVGYSVQFHHVEKLPSFESRTKGTKTFIVPDSIEGWCDAFGVLLSTYSIGEATFPEYQGYIVHFDYSLIRSKGSMISGGFKAPGSEGLKKSIEKVEELMNKVNRRLTPINCYDIICHMADAVLSGGVRRSATICLFNLEDEEMIKAKTGNWYYENPQRARSNNSIILVRDEVSEEQFLRIFEYIKQFGEPGFVFVSHRDFCFNPCVEIGMWPQTRDGRSGWQGCNLTSIIGARINTLEKFKRACIASGVLGTLQAAYTDFKYVAKESKEIFDEEALLGCSITGWLNNPQILLVEENMKMGAQIILDTNEKVAGIIGINPCARGTCVKPEGNTSVLGETASGAGGEHAPLYFRLMQINKDAEMARYLAEYHSYLIEDSVWSRGGTDYVVYVPIEAKKGSIFKKDLIGTKQLEIVKSIQQHWVESGTRVERCLHPGLRHNVSNTIEVEDWDEVGNYVWKNKQWFAGISFLARTGDRDFKQAPFTSVITPQEILEKYGDAAMFASGLIVDGLHAFEDLWTACDYAQSRNLPLEGTRLQVMVKRDWLRRAKQFSKRYFKNDISRMIYCLKDLHIYHKWVEINRELKPIDFTKINLRPNYIDADTLGSASCIGGACEIPS